MICGKAVDDVHVLPQCILILHRAQHRFDLTFTVTYDIQVILGQEEVMRSNLAGDLHASILGQSDCFNLETKSKGNICNCSVKNLRKATLKLQKLKYTPFSYHLFATQGVSNSTAHAKNSCLKQSIYFINMEILAVK